MKQDSLSISIAICTYNGSLFIEAQIQSILSQTRLPTELIVRDDGSTDDTFEKVQSLAKCSKVPIYVFKNALNLGVTRNFQAAINDCVGDIIFLADQDDVWFPDKVTRMIKPFEKHETVGLVYSDALVTEPDLKSVGYTVFDSSGRSRIWKGSDRDPLDLLKRPGVKGCTMAFRSSQVRKILPIPEINGKPLWTHDYWIAIMLHILSDVISIDEPLMYYRIHGKNTSGLIKPNSEAIARTDKPYRSYYSTKRTRSRAILYEGLLTATDDILSKGVNEFGKDAPRIRATLSGELSILNERLAIWEESHALLRASHAIAFLLEGKYGKFKSGSKEFVKDFLGANR